MGNVIPSTKSLCGVQVYNVDLNITKFSDLLKINNKKKKKKY